MTKPVEHTPGHWRFLYDERRDNYQIHSGTAGQSHWIANTKCESVPAHHEANARLISAAPELLAALEQAEISCDELCRDQDPANQCWVTLKEVRAAIAKAKGTA